GELAERVRVRPVVEAVRADAPRERKQLLEVGRRDRCRAGVARRDARGDRAARAIGRGWDARRAVRGYGDAVAADDRGGKFGMPFARTQLASCRRTVSTCWFVPPAERAC